jgi:dGTPase
MNLLKEKNMSLIYHKLSDELQKHIIEGKRNHYQNPYRCKDEDIIRRDMNHDIPNLWRPAFVRDIEKILHLPYYNRYADKTQVFSFYNNDDITRRALHVQLVSRIARNIGSVLGLNLDLIEAIALGHDIGHTPFGHAGERFLDELLQGETGRRFNHNVQSARVLDKLFARNTSLQVLDGVLCHNGEFEQQEYRPQWNKKFETHDVEIESCYVKGGEAIKELIPMTLEGCVVRICDMIAYIGKDRQDAITAKIINREHEFSSEIIGAANASIINNLTVDIIENSYGKDYILLSKEAYADLKTAKDENYKVIYKNDEINSKYEDIIKPMFKDVYYALLEQLKKKDESSVIFKHHMNFIRNTLKYYKDIDYCREEPNQIVVDYIASMTDDYFVELHKKLFPGSKYEIEYISYFE